MKAYYATGWGGPEVMRYGDLPDPTPAPGEVRVAVHAASVNPVDWKLRGGILRHLPGQKLPRPLGTDFAGVVDALGEGVTGFAPGDRVYGTALVFLGRPGTHAELLAVDAERVRRLPEGISFTDGAALVVAGLTALNGLRLAGPRAGRRVLVNGATGGVGHLAVQMAVARGARVTAVCSAWNAGRARELGASEVIDYRARDFTQGQERYDLVFDAHAGVGMKRASAVLAPGGAYASTLPTPMLWARALLSPLLPGPKAILANLRTKPEDYAELERLVAAGKVRPIVERIFPLEEAARAFAALEAGGVVGKVVLRVR